MDQLKPGPDVERGVDPEFRGFDLAAPEQFVVKCLRTFQNIFRSGGSGEASGVFRHLFKGIADAERVMDGCFFSGGKFEMVTEGEDRFGSAGGGGSEFGLGESGRLAELAV